MKMVQVKIDEDVKLLLEKRADGLSINQYLKKLVSEPEKNALITGEKREEVGPVVPVSVRDTFDERIPGMKKEFYGKEDFELDFDVDRCLHEAISYKRSGRWQENRGALVRSVVLEDKDKNFILSVILGYRVDICPL